MSGPLLNILAAGIFGGVIGAILFLVRRLVLFLWRKLRRK